MRRGFGYLRQLGHEPRQFFYPLRKGRLAVGVGVEGFDGDFLSVYDFHEGLLAGCAYRWLRAARIDAARVDTTGTAGIYHLLASYKDRQQ